MKRILLCCCLFIVTLLAEASSVNKLQINVQLHDNGSASVVEHWNIDVTDDIKEWYLVEDHLGKIQIRNFQVTEPGYGHYVVEKEEWNTDRSLEEKAHRCGIIKRGEGHYELCWGVGSTGQHQYDVSYTLTGLVKSYSDADGFNHMFVARKINSLMNDISVIIAADSMQLDSTTARIWAFGFEGEIKFEKGKIIARPDMDEWSSDCGLIVMCRFPKGEFHPDTTGDEDSFESVKEAAFEGSTYAETDDDDDWSDIIGGLLATFGLIVLTSLWDYIWWVISLKPLRMKLRRKIFCGNISWWRDIPYDGNLSMARTVWKFFSDEADDDNDNILGAVMLRLIYHKHIDLKKDKKDKKGKVNVILLGIDDKASVEERNMYRLFEKAAGNDNVMTHQEMKDYMKEHNKVAQKFMKAMKKDVSFDEDDRESMRQLLGLRKFLKEFTLIEKRGTEEVQLWKEYLVYAQLFGIARRVREQLQTVWPEFYQLAEEKSGIDYLMVNDYASSFTSTVSSSASAGEGGSSSYGGGGGCSGGGCGGGGR